MTARPIDTPFPGHGCTDDLTNDRSFDLQATWVIDVLGLLFRHVIHGCLYNQSLASTGAGTVEPYMDQK